MQLSGRSSLLVFSVFQVCIILGLFQGFILSSVVRVTRNLINLIQTIQKTQTSPFTINDDFPQLLKDKKLFIVTASLSDWLFQEIQAAYSSPYYELREALKFNKYELVETQEDALRLIDNGMIWKFSSA